LRYDITRLGGWYGPTTQKKKPSLVLRKSLSLNPRISFYP
jgi:hypothetical protein